MRVTCHENSRGAIGGGLGIGVYGAGVHETGNGQADDAHASLHCTGGRSVSHRVRGS